MSPPAGNANTPCPLISASSHFHTAESPPASPGNGLVLVLKVEVLSHGKLPSYLYDGVRLVLKLYMFLFRRKTTQAIMRIKIATTFY